MFVDLTFSLISFTLLLYEDSLESCLRFNIVAYISTWVSWLVEVCACKSRKEIPISVLSFSQVICCRSRNSVKFFFWRETLSLAYNPLTWNACIRTSTFACAENIKQKSRIPMKQTWIKKKDYRMQNEWGEHSSLSCTVRKLEVRIIFNIRRQQTTMMNETMMTIAVEVTIWTKSCLHLPRNWKWTFKKKAVWAKSLVKIWLPRKSSARNLLGQLIALFDGRWLLDVLLILLLKRLKVFTSMLHHMMRCLDRFWLKPMQFWCHPIQFDRFNHHISLTPIWLSRPT